MPSLSIAVIGLGYVGLPLALALSRCYSVIGHDISDARIAELKDGVDCTGAVASSELAASSLDLSADPGSITGADYFIVTVPTP